MVAPWDTSLPERFLPVLFSFSVSFLIPFLPFSAVTAPVCVVDFCSLNADVLRVVSGVIGTGGAKYYAQLEAMGIGIMSCLRLIADRFMVGHAVCWVCRVLENVLFQARFRRYRR